MERAPAGGQRELDVGEPIGYRERYLTDDGEQRSRLLPFAGQGGVNKEFWEDKDNKGDRVTQRRMQTLRDARNKCRRLAIANFNAESLFITLTYASEMEQLEDQVSVSDKHFKAFIRKLSNRGKDKFDYIAVREFTKRGRVHYHMICNAPLSWQDNDELRALERKIGEEVWCHGFVDIQRMNKTKKGQNVDNVGAYLTKYMTKEVNEERLKGKKAYLSSKGLAQPEVFNGIEALKIVEAMKTKKETFTNEYDSEYLGKINYLEYNLLRS